MTLSVTIMIPTFRQSQYIIQAVESALQQDYEHLEIIVSDDSPEEDTRTVLYPYTSDTRFYYYKNPARLGRVANYRKLLYNLAKGDWVVMLDGDDYYTDSSFISRAMQVVNQDPSIVLVGAGIKAYYQSSGKYEFYGLGEEAFIVDGKEVFKYKKLPNHQTDIYPRRLACDLDFYRDPSMGSDSESLYRLCLYGKLAYLPEAVAVWRIHDQNTTFTRDLNQQIKELKFIDSIYAEALPKLDKKIAGEWYHHMYKTMSAQLLNLAFRSRQYFVVLKILFLFNKYLGLTLSIHYLKQWAKSIKQGFMTRK